MDSGLNTHAPATASCAAERSWAIIRAGEVLMFCTAPPKKREYTPHHRRMDRVAVTVAFGVW